MNFAVVLAAAALLSGGASSVVLERPSIGAVSGPPERAALQVAARLAPSLGLAEGASFAPVATFSAPDGGHVVRLAQRHRGLPVLDAVVTVRLGRAGEVLRVHSSAMNVGDVDVKPALSAQQAVRVARGAVRLPLPPTESGVASLVVARAHGGRLAWQVFVPTAVPVHSIHVVVDALTGAVLGARDGVRHGGGRANVFADGASAYNARQADGTFNAAKLSTQTLSGLLSTDPGSRLTPANAADGSADGIVGYNCCPTQNCDGATPVTPASGTFPYTTPFGPVTVNFTMPVCSEVQSAVANADGDFMYLPGKEPQGTTVDPANLVSGDGDAFAEVMGYHWARKALDRMRVLDPAFKLGQKARPLRVVANYVLPNFQEAYSNVQFDQATGQLTTRVTTLMRLGNAAFLPAGEDQSGIPVEIPGLTRDHDAILLFQGPGVDFAYDPDVIAHEFTHAVVQVSAGLLDLSLDEQGVVDAPGAINEALSDYFAAALTGDPRIGEYVGRFMEGGEGTLRDLGADHKCPTVITGEVHDDSRHFSAALWRAREAVAADDAARVVFDRAILTALRTLDPYTTFDAAGTAIIDEVGSAFDEAAKTKTRDALTAQAVVGCERVIALQPGTAASGYLLAGMDQARGFVPAPGPVQFRLTPPAGATQVKLNLAVRSGDMLGGAMGGGQPSVRALLKSGARLAFRKQGNIIVGDHEVAADFSPTNGQLELAVPLDEKCEPATWFLALANNGGAQFIESLDVVYSVDADVVAGCTPPDAGTPAPDGGAPADEDGSGGDARGGGCGCGSAGLFVPAGALLFVVTRRRARRA